MMQLADALGAVVFALPGGSLEAEVARRGLPFRLLTLGELMGFKGTLLTVRSRDTLMAIISSIATGARVIRLNFTGKRIVWDAFVKRVIPLERLGWIEEGRVAFRKTDRWRVCIVSRLKRERRVGEVVERLSNSRYTFILYIVGDGDDSLVPSVSNPEVVFVRRKISKFREFLARMDLMVYPSCGTDKSCRAVLEAMDSCVAVISCVDDVKKYLDNHCGLVGDPLMVDFLLSRPATVRKMQLTAKKKVRSFYLHNRSIF